MPPKKNKKQFNGFYMYMQAMIPELNRQGYRISGMKDAVPICHPKWKQLSEEEKELYDRQAKQYKALKRNEEPSYGRLDNTGQLIDERVDPVVVNEKRRREERQKVREDWEGEGVILETFFMIDIQSLCKELKSEDVLRYLPCEIACVEFSLNAGIHKSWHKFINPPDIPIGFRFQCKNDSENTHQIPIQDFELAETDYTKIWKELCQFINPLRNREYPPLYCMMNNCDKVEWCLDWLAYKGGCPNLLEKVYELEGLVMDLFDHGGGNMPSKSQAHDLLTTSVFDYEKYTRCNYHEEIEVRFCSLGICKRYCFCLSDALANLYELELTGAHLPEKPDGSVYTVIEPHQMLLDVDPLQIQPVKPKQVAHGVPLRTPPTTTTLVKPADVAARRKRLESDLGPFSQGAPKPTLPAGRGFVAPVDKPLRRPHSLGIAASMSGVQWKGGEGAEAGNDDEQDWPSLGESSASSARRGGRGGIQSNSRYAGHSGPPPASAAPLPPTEWQFKVTHNSLKDLGNQLASDSLKAQSENKTSSELFQAQAQPFLHGYLGLGRGKPSFAASPLEAKSE
ncbi:protein maelstrom homolog isoform X2 [Glandiceps talaboti]